MSVVISDAWRQRFGGTARLYGEKALQLFADAHICVVVKNMIIRIVSMCGPETRIINIIFRKVSRLPL